MTDRQRRLAGDISHADYYRMLARTCGVSYANAGERFMGRVRAALDAGDEHLNTIPLSEWDARGLSVLVPCGAFEKHGDRCTRAGLVCMVKQAARDAAEGVAR